MNQSRPSIPGNSQAMTTSDPSPVDRPPHQSSFPYGQAGVMMGSTASLVGMLKAAALNSFHNLNVIHPDQDNDVSSQSSDSESIDGQPDLHDPLKSSTSKSDASSDVNIQPDSSQDFQEIHARRVVINRFASTLLHQHTAVQQTHADGSYRFNSSPTQAQSQSNWVLARPNIASSSSRLLSQSSQPLSPPPHDTGERETVRIDSNLKDSENDEGNFDDRASNSEEDHLQSVIAHFGSWSGTDSNGQPETEAWISNVTGILTRSVLVEGSMLLTNRRLCYIAYLPAIDMGEIIRSGPVTLPSHGKLHKRNRSWIELRTDCLTQYKSSTKPFRPIFSLHLSQIKHVLPIAPACPKILRLRLRNGKIFFAEFDTAEATSAWHADFINVLFSFKTHHSNKIKIMIPLRRIRKLHRDTFESLAKVMSLEIDSVPSINDIVENDVIEEKFTQQKFDRTRVQLSYLLSYGNFDDLVLDAIVRAKLEISNAGSNSKHQTPAPLLKITTISIDGQSGDRNETFEQTQNINSKDINKFGEAFGLEASSNLPIFPCSLLRTLPSSGQVAINKDYLCFWHRAIPVISSDYKLKIPLKRIRDVKPASAFGFHRYGLAIEVVSSPDIRLDFTSKSTRDTTIDALKAAVEKASSDPKQQSQSPTSQTLGQSTVPAKLTCPQPNATGSITRTHIGPIRPLRIVCLTIGSRGDVQPYISLAKRLMQDGHTVTIASHPEYRSWVESFGILYKDVGGDPAALMNFSVEHSFFSAGFFKEGLNYFKTWLEDLFMEAWLATKDSQAELLIESPSTFSGIHIAEALCIPYFRAFTMTWTSTAAYPQAFASSIDLGPSYNLLSYSLFDILIWRAMSRPVNKWRKHTLHIPPTSLEKMQAYKVPFMYNFSSAVVPKPVDWRDHIDVTGYWFLDQSQKNFVPPEKLIKFIASAKHDQVPLVYVGFGSVTVPDSTAVTKAIYSAIVQAGVRGIVAKGWSDRLEAKSKKEELVPPPEVYILDAIPHDWLFPQVDAVCHHGGAGTTGISLRFGIPTIIHPFFGDQTFWADRVSQLGAGLKIDSLSVHVLSEAFKKATSDRIIKEKALQAKERIQTEDGPGRAVQFIYQYLDFALERTLHRIERTKPKNMKRLKPLQNANPNHRSNQESSTRSRSSVLYLKSSKRGRSAECPQIKEIQSPPNPKVASKPSSLELPKSPSGEEISGAPASTLTAEPETFLPSNALQLPSRQQTASSSTVTSGSEPDRYISLKEVGRAKNNFVSMGSTVDSPVTKNKQRSSTWSLRRITR